MRNVVLQISFTNNPYEGQISYKATGTYQQHVDGRYLEVIIFL